MVSTSSPCSYLICVVLILSSGCGADSPSSEQCQPPVSDAGASADASDALDVLGEAETTEAEPVVLTQFELNHGTVRGQLIATYDHNTWWTDPTGEFTFALFDPARFEPYYADDRSIRLVSSLDVVSISSESSTPPHPETYRDLLRREGITIARVPVEGVAEVFTGHTSYHLDEDGYGNFAWDLVLTDEAGQRFTGEGDDVEDFLIWGADVFLPTSGTVIEVVRDEPDNTVIGQYEIGQPNNLLGVHLVGSYYLYLIHFQQGSIPGDIEVSDFLDAGAFVGRVGNSGVSAEPHLHVTILYYDSTSDPPRSWSVPSEFGDLYVAPTPVGPVSHEEYSVPESRMWISSEPF